VNINISKCIKPKGEHTNNFRGVFLKGPAILLFREFVVPPKSDKCQQDLDKFLTLCSKLGVPIKAEKTVQPTTVITIYGIEVDSCNMECRLPQEKIDKVNKVHKQKIIQDM
jgi:hypothetical protein